MRSLGFNYKNIHDVLVCTLIELVIYDGLDLGLLDYSGRNLCDVLGAAFPNDDRIPRFLFNLVVNLCAIGRCTELRVSCQSLCSCEHHKI